MWDEVQEALSTMGHEEFDERINRPEPIVLVHFGPYAQFLHFGDHRGEPMYFGDHVISPCTLESIEKILGCLQPVLCIWSRYNVFLCVWSRYNTCSHVTTTRSHGVLLASWT